MASRTWARHALPVRRCGARLAGAHRAGAALAAVIALAPLAATANVGPPSWGGQLAGEPAGITGVAILREDLVIDLRPLADDGQVAVSAVYHLDNRGAEQHLALVFASGSGTPGDFRVTLDARPIASAVTPGATLPASWRAPDSTPLPDGGELDYELRHEGAPVGFQLDVAPGRHELSISYAADAVRHHHDEPTLLRQFAYVLSPARAWAGFGALDITVRVPPGWRAGVSPALARDHDTLHAEVAGVPADAIALTVQAPAGAYGVVCVAGGALFAIVAVGGGIGVYLRTRSREQRRASAGKLPSGVFAFGRGLAWAVGFLATGLFAIFGPDLALPVGQADHYGYGQGLAAMAVGIGAVVVLVIGVWIARIAGRRVYAALVKVA
jgi:hypothetical protein